MRNAGGALPSRHILGNYELFEEIGRGGMGIVYRALDLSLDRVVAVKILRDDLRAHQSIVTRFSREAQAAARLDHDNIVQIYSVGSVERTPFIAMEYVDGLPLSAIMQREHRLDWKPALEIGRQIARALACAHECHVIHRDVKPPNILIDDRNRAYVTDFGIAKILTLDDNLTVDGTRLGTPHYMAPERCKSGEVTASSDLYSLGVLLFQMLTGRLPYEGSTPVDMIQRITSEPPARVRKYVPEVPEDVERLVAWLMEMNPKHRPATGQIVCDAIDRVMAGKPLDANGNNATEVMEDFRKSLLKSKEAAKGKVDSPDGYKHWRRIAAIGAIIAVLAVTAVAVLGKSGSGLPSGTALTSNADAAGWFERGDVSTFSDEGNGVALAQFAFPGYDMANFSFAGGDGAAVAVLEHPATHKRALCTIAPETRQASLLMVAAPSVGMELSATMQRAGTVPAGILRWAGRTHIVSFAAAPSDLVASVDANFSAAAISPNGGSWAAGRIDDAGCSLVTYALDNTRAAPTPIAPAGARIKQIQYSHDGQMLAYVRETFNGLFALRVAPVSGVTEGIAPLKEGQISLSQNAFNADGSMILVSETEAGRSVTRALSTTDGRIVFELGTAWNAAWTPAGDMIVFSAPDHRGAAQLWTVNAANPNQRTQRTFVDGGVGHDVTVSPDGRWAMSTSANNGAPGLVFVRMIQQG